VARTDCSVRKPQVVRRHFSSGDLFRFLPSFVPCAFVPWDGSRCDPKKRITNRSPPRSQPLFVPHGKNSRRAQRGHTKCSKSNYGSLWADMATNPCRYNDFCNHSMAGLGRLRSTDCGFTRERSKVSIPCGAHQGFSMRANAFQVGTRRRRTPVMWFGEVRGPRLYEGSHGRP